MRIYGSFNAVYRLPKFSEEKKLRMAAPLCSGASSAGVIFEYNQTLIVVLYIAASSEHECP